MTENVAPYDRDEEHIKLLGIFHYVMAGLDLLGLGAAAVYLGIAVFLPVVIERSNDADVPEHLAGTLGLVFGAVGLGIALLSLTAAALTAFAGWSLHRHRNRMLILIVSALHLMSMPFGTVLGIFTIIVMSRPEVSARFAANSG